MDFSRKPLLAAVDQANPWIGKNALIDRRYVVYSVVIFAFALSTLLDHLKRVLE